METDKLPTPAIMIRLLLEWFFRLMKKSSDITEHFSPSLTRSLNFFR